MPWPVLSTALSSERAEVLSRFRVWSFVSRVNARLETQHTVEKPSVHPSTGAQGERRSDDDITDYFRSC